MKVPELRIASISDVHLGHRKNETGFIVKNLYAAFPDDAETAQLDIIFIAGDFFDRLLNYPDDEIHEIQMFVVYLEALCAKHDIVLRVLEGTRSHDCRQSVIFERMAESAKIKCDVKYFPEPAIEYIERFDINVLYVPDEWSDSTDKTLAHVKELMRLRGLEKVDFAVMHGQFEYQLPEVVKAPKHSSKDYLEIVDKLIFIGHVHVFSNYERIIAQGSFDRIAHGEEAPKGHVRARVSSRDDYRVTFVANQGARKFRTVNCAGLSLQDTLKKIGEETRDVPDRSFVRVEADADNPIHCEMGELLKLGPLIHWSKKKLDKDEQLLKEEDPFEQQFVPVTITPDNISTLIEARLRIRSLSDVVLKRALSELDLMKVRAS